MSLPKLDIGVHEMDWHGCCCLRAGPTEHLRSIDPRLEDLHRAIKTLPPLQKAIIEADLAAGSGLADAGRLAEIHGTSMNSIYVSRSKARENLKKQVERPDRRPEHKRR